MAIYLSFTHYDPSILILAFMTHAVGKPSPARGQRWISRSKIRKSMNWSSRRQHLKTLFLHHQCRLITRQWLLTLLWSKPVMTLWILKHRTSEDVRHTKQWCSDHQDRLYRARETYCPGQALCQGRTFWAAQSAIWCRQLFSTEHWWNILWVSQSSTQ